ncbi:MAG: SRPBCC family protein [Chloroflexota bacterium]
MSDQLTLPADTSEFQVSIQADPATVYQLIAEPELWPAILPHIRAARVLRRTGSRRLVSVAASWRGLPVGWRAVQQLEPSARRVTFRHVMPVSRGTTVTWTVMQDAAGTTILRVQQQMRLARWLPGRCLLQRLLTAKIGPEMARQMLARLRYVAEGGSLSGRD